MAKQWVIRKEISPDLIKQILFYRGIKTAEEAESFLNPNYEKHLHDPFSMKDMGKGVERILRAIKNKERIIVFGDYDADGVCASAIFYEFFKKVGFENFHFHIPDRHLDGYGLTKEAISEFAEQKAKLLITVDCGITDCKEVEMANSAGIDVVITDHHLPQEEIPKAFAIIDSKQKGDEYPFKDLCGAGVAFKVVQALIDKGEFNITKGWEKWLLDLACLATVADMVPLVGENRIITHYGLQVLRKTYRPGLIAFFKRMNVMSKNINEDDIAFVIAPRLNIASRMEHANTSFNLLITESSGEADWIAGHLDGLNGDRREIVDEIILQIEEKISKYEKIPEVVVEGDLSWNTGVLGLLANRLIEKYQRPVFLWGKGMAKETKGSCRSDGSVNLVDLMGMLPKETFVEFGGHAMAGGFTIKKDNEEEFKKEILDAFKKSTKQDTENNILNIDKELSIEDVNWDTWGAIEKIQPFGMNNPKPVFLFSDLEIFNAKKFGNGGIHLQLDFNLPRSAGKNVVSAIGFFASGDNLNLIAGQKIDLVASLERSTFRNFPELRLRIIDIKIKA